MYGDYGEYMRCACPCHQVNHEHRLGSYGPYVLRRVTNRNIPSYMRRVPPVLNSSGLKSPALVVFCDPAGPRTYQRPVRDAGYPLPWKSWWT